jgi:membrane protease YdiL (CAAX protease family)
MSYLDLAARGKTSWWRYPVTWILAIALAIVVLIGGLIPLVVAGVVTRDTIEAMQSASAAIPFYMWVGGTFAAALLGFAIAIRLIHKKSPRDIIGDWRWGRVLAGGGIWLVVILLGEGIDYALRPSGFEWTGYRLTAPFVATAVAALIIQPFAEEFVFRGYMTQAFLHWLKKPFPAAILSGLLFGAFHLPNGIPQAVANTVFGIVTAYIAIRTGSIATSYGMHVVNNLFAAIVVASASDIFHGTPALWTQVTPELLWGDVAFECVALVVVVFVFTRRKAT